jgi:parallel beta-helix repeat protein
MKLALLVVFVLSISMLTSGLFFFAGESKIACIQPVNVKQLSDSLYSQHDKIGIFRNSDFEYDGFPGSGTEEDPYIIEWLNITTGKNSDSCIIIQDVTAHWIVRNCFLKSYSARSLKLTNSVNGLIESCIMTTYPGSSGSNIYTRWANDIEIVNNTITDNGAGIYITESSQIRIINNTISRNYNGINIASSSFCNIANNTVVSNTNTGLNFDNANNCNVTNNMIENNDEDGIVSGSSTSLRISNNSISWNGNYGMFCAKIPDSVIYGNSILNNSIVGLYITSGNPSNQMQIVSNNILNNTADVIVGPCPDLLFHNNWLGEVIDDGYDNQWDDGISRGNYWNDYDGSGNYSVPGTANSIDRYPFSWGDVPFLDHPVDINYEIGSESNQLIWHPSDSSPDSFIVFKDGAVNQSGVWGGTDIILDIDGLSVGSYNYTLVVNDTLGHSALDTAMVNVYPVAPPSIDSPDDVQYELGWTGYTVTWNVSDLTPSWYDLYKNQVGIASGIWDGSQIRVIVDGLDVGAYNYTLVVFDLFNNSGTDSVWVIVTEDVTSPTINSPDNFGYELGTTGYDISWSPFDLNPAKYNVLKNGSTIETGIWNGSLIVVTVDGLWIGKHNYTIIVYDVANNTAVDFVFVNVTDTICPIINQPSDLAFTQGEIGNSIIWNSTDCDPDAYEVYVNMTLEFSGPWNSSDDVFVLDVDDFQAGAYNCTLIVVDGSGNMANDTVWVFVESEETTTAPSPTTTTSPTETTFTSPSTTTRQSGDIQFVPVILGSIGLATAIIFVAVIIRKR